MEWWNGGSHRTAPKKFRVRLTAGKVLASIFGIKMACFLQKCPASTDKVSPQETGFQSLDHPLYSPDLAPPYYHLFPGLKKLFDGRHFSSVAEINSASKTGLDGYKFIYFFLLFAKGRATV
jgi:hypothetical protein